MSIYILHGGFLKERNEHNESLYRRIADAIPENGTVLLVFFAVQDETRFPSLHKDQKTRVEEYLGNKKANFVTATEKDFLNEVRNANVVLIRGGSTNKLLTALKAYNNLAEAFKGKLVMGSSVGAYALSAYNYDKSEKAIRPGFGLVPVKTIAHYESQTEEGVGEEAVEVMSGGYSELPLLILKDYEWKEFSI